MRPGACSLSSFVPMTGHPTTLPNSLRPEGVGHKAMLAARPVCDIKPVSILDEFLMKNTTAAAPRHRRQSEALRRTSFHPAVRSLQTRYLHGPPRHTDDGQSQPSARRPVRPSGLSPVEALEHMRYLIRLDPRTGVFHLELRAA